MIAPLPVLFLCLLPLVYPLPTPHPLFLPPPSSQSHPPPPPHTHTHTHRPHRGQLRMSAMGHSYDTKALVQTHPCESGFCILHAKLTSTCNVWGEHLLPCLKSNVMLIITTNTNLNLFINWKTLNKSNKVVMGKRRGGWQGKGKEKNCEWSPNAIHHGYELVGVLLISNWNIQSTLK